MTFEHLTDSEFEELTYDLLNALGFVNLDWRRGSPHRLLSRSGSDSLGYEWPSLFASPPSSFQELCF
jgi:hypothetical protein